MMLKETETIELKRSLAQLKEGVISLGAMLNKHHKGEVYFGINDNGDISGLTIGRKTLADISHEIQNNLRPLPDKLDIKELTEEGKNIILVSAAGEDTPYCSYGRYYIRINDSDILMEASQLQNYFQNKEETYSWWEEKETDFTPDDINESLLIDCIRAGNENGRLNYIYKNPYDALNRLGLLTKSGHLNNAGFYLFSNKEPLLIKEACYPTDSRTEFGEIKEFHGNIFECIEEATSYIRNHMTFHSKIVGIQREDTPEIPLKALREIIVNSFAHCSYAKKGDYHQFIIYKSSIRIYNPGPILQGIDPMEFATGQVGSKIRNPLISSALYKFGLIDAFGTGFDRVFTLCADQHVEYKYQEDDFGFTFIFKRTPLSNDKISDSSNDRLNDRLNIQLISLLKENKYSTTTSLSALTNKSVATINRHLKELIENGSIKRIGSKKNGYWLVIEP